MGVVSKAVHLPNTKVRLPVSPMAFTVKCSVESESKGTSFLVLAALTGNLLLTSKKKISRLAITIAKLADSV